MEAHMDGHVGVLCTMSMSSFHSMGGAWISLAREPNHMPIMVHTACLAMP